MSCHIKNYACSVVIGRTTNDMVHQIHSNISCKNNSIMGDRLMWTFVKMGTNIIGVRNKSIPALQCSGGEWHSLAWHEFYMARNLSTAITSQWLPSPLLFLASSSDESMEKVHRPGFPSHSDQSQTTKNQISHIALFLYVRGKIH